MDADADADEPDADADEPDAPEPDADADEPDLRSEPDVDECEGRDDGLYKDSCDEASDCCNGLCLGRPDVGLGFCTMGCASYADCNPVGLGGAPFFCTNAGDAGFLCAPSDFDSTCEAPTDCLGQVCLLGAGISSCSWQCATGADCPSGAACGMVGFDDGEGGFFPLRVCTQVGNPCLDFSNCLSGTCLTPDTGGLGYCSTFCSASDADSCPTGFTCAAIEGAGDTLCLRPGDL